MDQATKLILEKKNVFIYKIPPQLMQNTKVFNRSTNWDLSHPVKICKLTLTAIGPSCHIRLDDDDGYMFEQSVIHCYPGIKGQPSSFNAVFDSSRYFTLKVEKKGECYLIGLGFSERKDSSDLTKALANYFKYRNQIGEQGPMNPLLKQDLEPKPVKLPNVLPIKVKRNNKGKTDSNGVTNWWENLAKNSESQVPGLEGPKDTLKSFRIPKIKKTAVSEISTSDPINIYAKVSFEQQIKEKKSVCYSKFETQLAEACHISIQEAELLNKKISKLGEIHQKEVLKNIDSEEKFGGAFRFRLPGNIFQCHLCPDNFSNSISIPGSSMPLIDHWKKVHQSEIFYCIPCCLVFANETQISFHTKLVHDYSCFVCHELIGKMRNVRVHLLNHHRPVLMELLAKQKQNPIKTDANAVQNETLKDSQNTVESGDPKTANETDHEEINDTKKMEKTFGPLVETLINRNRANKLEQIGSEGKSCEGISYCLPNNGLKCHLCPAKFLRSSSGSITVLSRHWKKVHGNKCLNCFMCDLIFSSDEQLNLHKQIFHHADCFFCNAKFRKERILRRHIFSLHKKQLLKTKSGESAVQTDEMKININSNNEDNVDGSIESREDETDSDDTTFEKRKDRKLGRKRQSETKGDGDLDVKEPVYKVCIKIVKDECLAEANVKIEF